MVALKLDPFTQRRLLELAAADRLIGSAGHRRQTLPELAVIEQGSAEAAALTRDVVIARTEVDDL